MNLIARPCYRSWLLVVGVLVCVAGSPKTAYADDDETESADSEEGEAQAANLFALAESAFAARDYEHAARLFLRADAKAPHASVMYNAAVSWDYAGKRAPAADSYQTALERDGLTPQQHAQAERRLDELGKYLGLVHVAKPVGGIASVERMKRRTIPFQFFQEPGSYRVELETAEGAKTTTDITVLPGQTLRLELNPVESEKSIAIPIPSQPRTVSTPPAPPPALPRDEAPSSTQEVIGWVGIGIGIMAAGAATYWGLQVLEKRDAFVEGGQLDADLRSDGLDLRTRSNIGWVSSAVTGATGLTLVLTSPTFRF